MNTFYDIFGVSSTTEAYVIIHNEINKYEVKNPKNLEEQAINMVGKTIYEKLIKNYTEKQWGKKCTELSPDIIKRLSLRYSFNNNYFNDYFQAIPKNGYTEFVKNIIGDIPYLLNWNFNYNEWHNKCKCIIYCGAIDELLDYQLGELEWRSLKFEDMEYQYNGFNGQGMTIKNDVSTNKYTRYVEHMWFTQKYYAVNNSKTEKLYNAYRDLLLQQMPEVELGGRLGKYKYFDMDDTIFEAMKDAEKLININT